MNPVRVNCFAGGELDNFLLEHDRENKFVTITELPEFEFYMSRDQLTEFIRLLNIRLEAIS